MIEELDKGALWRVTFGDRKGNVLDRRTMAELSDVFRTARSRSVKAICLTGAGSQFSFGASVQEHLPGDVTDMLRSIRQLILDLLDSDVIVLAAVRGQCLGGGLELASVCHRIFANRNARFGQPEIALGVFAPLASIVLPIRIGRANAEDLCLTGRSITASEARRMGLVDEIASRDPADAALRWARRHLGPRSASSLRLAVRAIRMDLAATIRNELPKLEELYLTQLMTTADAAEGLSAFLEKRRPQWKDA